VATHMQIWSESVKIDQASSLTFHPSGKKRLKCAKVFVTHPWQEEDECVFGIERFILTENDALMIPEKERENNFACGASLI
jgi:hypothetical protein